MCLAWLWRLVSGETEEGGTTANDGSGDYKVIKKADDGADLEMGNEMRSSGQSNADTWNDDDTSWSDGDSGWGDDHNESIDDQQLELELARVTADNDDCDDEPVVERETLPVATALQTLKSNSRGGFRDNGEEVSLGSNMELFESMGMTEAKIVKTKRVTPRSNALAAAARDAELETASSDKVWDLDDMDLDLDDASIENFLNSD